MKQFHWKKSLALLLTLALCGSMAACGGTSGSTSSDTSGSTSSSTDSQTEDASTGTDNTVEDTSASAEPTEVIVFAAASMTETLNELKDVYEAANEGVTLTYNFDSSGTLKTQIEEGAACDVFISAGQKQMNQLDSTASADDNPDGLDFVKQGSRINLLENKVVLCVPDPNAEGAVSSFDDMAARLQDGSILLAMGNSDVPVGQYTQKILAYYQLDEQALANAGSITYGTNVKEVTTQVSEASVDCGVIYCTDAFSAGLEIVDSATAEMCGQVIYPAAVMNDSAQPDAAQAFLDFLTTDEAMAVFENVGFSPAE